MTAVYRSPRSSWWALAELRGGLRVKAQGPGAPRLSGVGLGSLRGDRAGDRPLFPSLTTLHTSFQPSDSFQVPVPWSCLFFQP